MSFPLDTLPTVADDLQTMDSRQVLPPLMALMKNTFVRSFNTIHCIAPLLDASDPKLAPFLEYIRGILEILCVHLEGDIDFFSGLDGVLQGPKDPRYIMERLSSFVHDFRRDVLAWMQDPSLYTPSAVEKHLDTAPVMVKLMRSQLEGLTYDCLESRMSNEDLRAKVEENMIWFAERCELSFLFPFILAHHDRGTSVHWPAVSAEAEAAMPTLVEQHSECWEFAPYNPLTRKAQIWMP
ncbi:hypothetical protein PLICRDRAFT_34711 [Plicaturopsis crispa FD-325 SS-3]|nr:hypothetical protein PLICRDRAFT_34711 [Plicaturopsis crispa FD-325 SS-3]